MAGGEQIRITQAKGRPMLSWVGKRPLREVRAFPAQLVERFAPEAPAGIAADVDSVPVLARHIDPCWSAATW